MVIAADTLPDDPATLKAMLVAERAEVERLRLIIKEFQRHRFGRRAESLSEDQLQLGLEELAQTEAAAAAEEERQAPARRAERAAARRGNRGRLPAHLPRIETVVDVEDKSCRCCGGALHCIGEDVAERLDVVPAQFRVLVVRRPKYACRSCEEGIVQAPAPARLIEGGIPTEATVAHVLVTKYADHVPLYRQAQIWRRQGVALDRSTLADWVGRAAFLLRPVHERMLALLKSSARLFAGPGPRSGRPPPRSSIPAAAAPRPGSCGPMPATTARGAVLIRRRWSIAMLPIARPNGRSHTSPASRACCRWTATVVIACSPSAAR